MAQDFLSGVRTGASLGGMIQGNISRRKEEKRQAQFDKKRLTDMDINIALKQARLKKARMAIESTAQGRNPSDPYDRYTQLYSRHAEETSKAQQALELAQRSGDPGAIHAAQQKMWVVENVGQKLFQDYEKGGPTKTITKTHPDGTTEKYDVPFDPAQEAAQNQQNFVSEAVTKMFPTITTDPMTGEVDQGAVDSIRLSPQFQEAVESSPAFQAKLAEIQGRQPGGSPPQPYTGTQQGPFNQVQARPAPAARPAPQAATAPLIEAGGFKWQQMPDGNLKRVGQ